jgi:YVTN family beta-propeller protein
MLLVMSNSSNTLVATLQLGINGEYPIYPFLDSANGELYVSNSVANTTSIISGDTVVATVPVGSNPTTPFLNPKNGDIYVPNYLSNYLSVISGTTNTVVANVTIGEGVGAETFDPNNGDIYLTSSNPCINGFGGCFSGDVPGYVLILSAQTNTMIGSITLNFEHNSALPKPAPLTVSGLNPDYPSAPVFNSANGDIYVSNGGGNTVSVISGVNNSLLTNVVVGHNPDTPAFDPLNGDVYVPNSFDGTVSVISSATNSVVATVKASPSPQGVFFNPVNGDIYAPDLLSGNLSIIAGTTNTLVAHVEIGSQPKAFVLDAVNGEVYAACDGGGDATAGSIWAISYSTTP